MGTAIKVEEVKELSVVPYSKMDLMGNELEVASNGSVTLSLISEGKRIRGIGQLMMTSKGQLVYEKKVREDKHLFRKFNAWGFHYAVIDGLDERAWLRVISDKKKYAIQVKDAKKVAKYLQFKEQGFEKQAFIPLDFWQSKDL